MMDGMEGVLGIDAEVERRIAEKDGSTALQWQRRGIVEIPPSISQLNSLTALDLMNNELCALPHELGRLKSLTSLCVGGNRLRELPECISCLTSLRFLDIQQNIITTLPHGISCLTALTSFNVGSNQLTKIPKCISCLAALNFLDVKNKLHSLVLLIELKVHHNLLMDLPQQVSCLSNLFSLSGWGNKFTALPALGGFSSLQSLCVQHNSISSLPIELSCLTSLTELDVGDNGLVELPSQISLLSSLTFLSMQGNFLRHFPTETCSLPFLEVLNVAFNQISILPEQIALLTRLKFLDIRNNLLLNLPLSMTCLSSLTSISVTGNPLPEGLLAESHAVSDLFAFLDTEASPLKITSTSQDIHVTTSSPESALNSEEGEEEPNVVKQMRYELMQLKIENQVLRDHQQVLTNKISEISADLQKFVMFEDHQRQEDEKQATYVTHILDHVHGGIWKDNFSSGPRSSVCIILEGQDSRLTEVVCRECPLEKVVKMTIQKRFGVDENEQIVFMVTHNKEIALSPFFTLSQYLEDEIPLLKVTIKPVLTIKESDLPLISSLGAGSYGVVFKCMYLPIQKPVAVKALHEVLTSQYNVARFMKEAKILAGFRHPNILGCYGTCKTRSGSLWIVSELMECNLRQLLSKKRLCFQEFVALALGISKGMSALHRQNYMHRDLSSNNVLLDSTGTPKIADFGIACQIPPAHMRDSGQTCGAGTPFYMAPQMHTPYYSIQGDIWAFGILLSETIQGKIDSAVNVRRTTTQIISFLDQQQRQSTPIEAAEIERLCGEISDIVVVECLDRKNACLKATASFLSEFGTAFPQTCCQILETINQSCLSILESQRPPFTVIENMLYACSTFLFATHLATPDEIDAAISSCLQSLSPFITTTQLG
ncbi:small GTP-binding protein [Pelomyxa schiedti]|nr:small GTP-binding protein [Pelomyxa schiedti]